MSHEFSYQKRHRGRFEDRKCEKQITLTVVFRAYNEKLMPLPARGGSRVQCSPILFDFGSLGLGHFTNVLQSEHPSETAWNDSITVLTAVLDFTVHRWRRL